MTRWWPTLALGLFAVAPSALADRPVTITFLHTNDMHAHLEPTMIRKRPFGGYARQATLIKRFRQTDPNVILLNAGDTFQGTLYFNVYEGLADLAYMNAIGYQAMAVGNHEFDRGPGPLATFAKSATFPLLSANLDVSREPLLRGLIKPSTVINVGGARVGIVGAITPDAPTITSPGPNVAFPDITTSVQRSIDDLTRQGIDKIVLLSHVGYEEEKALAARLRGVDLLIGGHSHSPLGLTGIEGFPRPAGPYPTRVKGADGQDVLLVQAWEWGKVLGRIKLDFDGKGRITRVREAAPVVVDETVPEDPAIASLITALNRPITALQSQPIGTTTTGISSEGKYRGESPMANVIADAMMAATQKAGAVAAFINAGGVRSSIDEGSITYGEAITVQPFGNTLVVLDLTGDELRRALEHGVAGFPDKMGAFLHPSRGTSYRFDPAKPAGSRVSEVVIGGQPLDPAKTYPIALLGFTASGGDAHEVLKAAPGRRVDTGLIDVDALVDYIKANSPLNPKPERRIRTP